MAKPLVIYHSNCTDGFGAAFAAWLQLGDEAEYVPCNYGPQQQQVIDTYDFTDRDVYVLDFNFSKTDTMYIIEEAARFIWLDHHKTAFESWIGAVPEWGTHTELTDKRWIQLDNNKSGALLAWNYFRSNKQQDALLINHIDDYDRWVFAMQGTRELHAALNARRPWSFEQWATLWTPSSMKQLYVEGEAILRAHNSQVDSTFKNARKCRIPLHKDGDFGGTPEYAEGLVCNGLPFLTSDLGHKLANESNTYGLVWYIAREGKVRCSLRSNGEYDVSAIAKLFGGGGHKNAAGFEVELASLLSWMSYTE